MAFRGCRRVRKSKGFTLVEILVVLVIMAIVVSIAVLSIGTTGKDSQLDQETLRIQGLMDILHERALLEGRDFGLRIQPNSYEWVVYSPDRDRWLIVSDEGEFRHRDLPKGVTFELELDQVQVVLKAVDKTFSSDEAPPPPQVAIAASGEGTPFRLTLQRDATQARASVDGDAFGKTTHESSDQRRADSRS